MRRSRWWSRDDTGSASLEFITLGVLLLVPLIYLVLAVSAVQAGSLGVEGASRQAARVFVDATDESGASAASASAVRVALADAGLAGGRVSVACTPDPDDCLAPSSLVTVTVTASVPLPFVPAALAAGTPAGVQMSATATQQVSRFGGEAP